MRIECIGPSSLVEVELQALLSGRRRQSLLGGDCLLLRHPVLRCQVRREVSFRQSRRSWVQLEGSPGHVDIVAMGEAFEGKLETTLTYRAPRANYVRKDLDLHTHNNLKHADEYSLSLGRNGRSGHGL